MKKPPKTMMIRSARRGCTKNYSFAIVFLQPTTISSSPAKRTLVVEIDDDGSLRGSSSGSLGSI